MSYEGWATVFICLSAIGTTFFSLAGVSLRVYSHVRLQEAFKAIRKEKLADKLMADAERLILACSLYRLLCNMAVVLLLVSLLIKPQDGGASVWDYVLTAAVALAIFGVLGLAVPHAWAKYAGEKVLSSTYGVLVFFAFLAAPVLYLWKLLDGLVRRLAGVPEATPEEEHDEKQEEFLTGLEQQRIEGVMDAEEQHMIENVLELSETTAGEIMTPRTDIVALELNSDLETVLKTISEAGHTRVPVFEENIDKIVGLVYAKDLLNEIGADPAEFDLRERMRPAYFVPETKSLRILLHEFQTEKLHISVVLDEYGGTAGIVTLEDILEELVGEITDEYEETPVESVMEIDENTIEVDARMYVDDINDQFGLDLPEDEDYDTVGGFVFSVLGYIPKAGETFEKADMKFTVVSAEPRSIKRIRIERTAELQ